MTSEDSSTTENSARALVWAFDVSGGALGRNQPGAGFGMALRIHTNALATERGESSRPQTQEYVGASSSTERPTVGESFAELLHRRIETLAPKGFLDGAEKLLIALELSDPTRIEVNNDSIPENGRILPLSDALNLCRSFIASNLESVSTIDVGSHGRNADFDLRISLQYLRKHKMKESCVKVEVNLLSRKLGPADGESFPQYSERMKDLDKDKRATSVLYGEIDAQRKEFYKFLSSKLEESFPDLKAEIFEDVILDSM